jgi:hypothetical protein
MQVVRLFSEIDGDAVRQGTMDGPTKSQRARLSVLETKAKSEFERLQQLVEVSIPQFNKEIEALKLPWIRIE